MIVWLPYQRTVSFNSSTHSFSSVVVSAHYLPSLSTPLLDRGMLFAQDKTASKCNIGIEKYYTPIACLCSLAASLYTGSP